MYKNFALLCKQSDTIFSFRMKLYRFAIGKPNLNGVNLGLVRRNVLFP